MHTSRIIPESTYMNFPVIDDEFDRFEINDDLEANQRKAETATFYHDAFDPEE